MSKKKSLQSWEPDALQAVRTLRSGGVLLHASDTVWGLAADAQHPEAVSRIFQIKKRPIEQTLITLVSSESQLEMLIPNLPEAAWELLEVSDRPVTIVGRLGANSRYQLAPGLVASDGTVAVRLVKDPYNLFILKGLDRPMASTSANTSGAPTPIRFQEVEQAIVEGVDFAGEHHRNEPTSSQPSMLVKFDEAGRIQLIRS